VPGCPRLNPLLGGPSVQNSTHIHKTEPLYRGDTRYSRRVSVETRGHRIRVEPATCHVKVALNGQVIADTRRPVLLHETGLPTRYYIPRDDVRMQLLSPTDKQTDCPFKGSASYWSLDTGDETIPNLVWSYEAPIESAKGITGLLCFYNEKVDLEVDGELQPRPKTPWS
jgi:uncharacterized protein (DUF427 family)